MPSGRGYDGDVGAEGGVLAHIELEGAAGGLAVLEGVGVIADDGVLIDFSAVDGQGAGLAAPAGVGEQIPVEIGGRGGGRGGAHRQAQDRAIARSRDKARLRMMISSSFPRLLVRAGRGHRCRRGLKTAIRQNLQFFLRFRLYYSCFDCRFPVRNFDKWMGKMHGMG